MHSVQDGRSQELALFHPRTVTFLNSDLIYSTDPACCAGPGGPRHRCALPPPSEPEGLKRLYPSCIYLREPPETVAPQACMQVLWM